MRAWMSLCLLLLFAGTGLLQAQEYSQVNASITVSGDWASVRADSKDTGYTFMQFPAKVRRSSFQLGFQYMIKSENPGFDPSIFVRVYPKKQEIGEDWIKTRTREECYYYTASNGEMIVVGGTPLVKGRLEAYGPSGCMEKDCDYYYENNEVLQIPDGEWLDKKVPVECDNNGMVWIVVEMNKKTPGWIEWNLKNFSAEGKKIMLAGEQEKNVTRQEQENRTVQENKTVQNVTGGQAGEQEKQETMMLLKKVMKYSTIVLVLAVVIALVMLLKKKRRYKRMEVA